MEPGDRLRASAIATNKRPGIASPRVSRWWLRCRLKSPRLTPSGRSLSSMTSAVPRIFSHSRRFGRFATRRLFVRSERESPPTPANASGAVAPHDASVPDSAVMITEQERSVVRLDGSSPRTLPLWLRLLLAANTVLALTILVAQGDRYWRVALLPYWFVLGSLCYFGQLLGELGISADTQRHAEALPGISSLEPRERHGRTVVRSARCHLGRVDRAPDPYRRALTLTKVSDSSQLDQ